MSLQYTAISYRRGYSRLVPWLLSQCGMNLENVTVIQFQNVLWHVWLYLGTQIFYKFILSWISINFNFEKFDIS